MTTKDLAYFLEVCRQGSINAAARELYITTQGLSKILQKLETELGYPILVRTQTGVTLTDDGKILERHARKILQQMEGLNFEIAQRHKSHTGRLRIAASYGLLGLLSPACIVAFRKKYPDIQVDFSEYTDQRAVEAVWYHEVDVALTYLPVDNQKYQVRPIAATKLYLLVHRDNPLSRLPAVTMEQLNGQEFALQNREFHLHQLVLKKCREAGFEPQVVFETNGVCMCNQLCKLGLTVSVAPAHTMRNLRSPDVVLVPFADEEMQLHSGLIRKADEVMTHEMKLFYDFLETWQRPI